MSAPAAPPAPGGDPGPTHPAAAAAVPAAAVAELLSFADVLLEPDEATARLRGEVRSFVADQLGAGRFEPRCDAWMTGYSPEFSAELGRRGWLGMTWPRRYGGHERREADRFVVTEELLAAGAPVAAHWGTERQIGPQLLAYGSEALKARFLPQFAAGTCYFAAGMSEPDAGSDLAALSTRAEPVEGGWKLTGRKVWTSHAHRCHYMTVLCRTGPPTPTRHANITQLIVDVASPGITVTPIHLLSGEHHFNEVTFDAVLVPDEMVLGRPGDGWRQVGAELALERSGPDRFMSTFPLLEAAAADIPSDAWDAELGRAVASLWTLRWLSLGIVRRLQEGRDAGLAAAMVKDVGTRLDQAVPDVVRPHRDSLSCASATLLRQGIEQAPGFTLRGGTSEVLRMLVARGLAPR